MPNKLLFLDTNIFLHYQPFDQIDWPTLLQSSAVTIIIPPVTLRELNKHKDGGQSAPHIRKRADEAQKKLNRLFSGTSEEMKVRPNVYVRFEPNDPSVSELDPRLRPEIQDDQLIASILATQKKYPSADITLGTADEGLQLRVKSSQYGISCYQPDAANRLPEQRDPNEQRVRELGKENAELRRRIPDIKLAFEDGKSHATFSLTPPIELTDEIIKHKLDELRTAYPLISGKVAGTSEAHNNPYQQFERTLAQVAAAMSSASLTIQQEDIDEYNKELERFYRQYADFLIADAHFINLQCHTLKLNIHLLNEGTVPAEDIDVFLHFPDGFELFGEDDVPEMPEKPAPPRKPRTAMQKMQEQINFMSPRNVLIPPISRSSLPVPNVSAPSIQKTNSYNVDIHVDRAKHFLSEPFDPLFVIFDSYGEAKSFEIEYSLHAANVPKPVDGSLHIVVKKEIKP